MISILPRLTQAVPPSHSKEWWDAGHVGLGLGHGIGTGAGQWL